MTLRRRDRQIHVARRTGLAVRWLLAASLVFALFAGCAQPTATCDHGWAFEPKGPLPVADARDWASHLQGHGTQDITCGAILLDGDWTLSGVTGKIREIQVQSGSLTLQDVHVQAYIGAAPGARLVLQDSTIQDSYIRMPNAHLALHRSSIVRGGAGCVAMSTEPWQLEGPIAEFQTAFLEDSDSCFMVDDSPSGLTAKGTRLTLLPMRDGSDLTALRLNLSYLDVISMPEGTGYPPLVEIRLPSGIEYATRFSPFGFRSKVVLAPQQPATHRTEIGGWAEVVGDFSSVVVPDHKLCGGCSSFSSQLSNVLFTQDDTAECGIMSSPTTVAGQGHWATVTGRGAAVPTSFNLWLDAQASGASLPVATGALFSPPAGGLSLPFLTGVCFSTGNHYHSLQPSDADAMSIRLVANEPVALIACATVSPAVSSVEMEWVPIGRDEEVACDLSARLYEQGLPV